MLVLLGAVVRRKEGNRTVVSERRYPVRFKNRKRAIAWLIKKLDREYPDANEISAEIVAEYPDL